MYRKSTILILTLFFLSASTVFGQSKTNITIGYKISVHSKILKENREILIYLPASYKRNSYTRYPVLYLLDGRKFFHSFTGVVNQLSSDASPQMPEMIVVGIASQARVRDSSPTKSTIGYRGIVEKGLEVSGGADDFLKFIDQELFPYITQNYRTNGYKTFAGYSFTGLPVLHCLFTKSEMFNSYLVIDFSAWWDDEVTLKNMKSFSNTYKGKGKDVFMTTEERVVNDVYPAQPNLTWTFIKEFEKVHPETINLEYKKYGYKSENHHTLPLVSFVDGMKYIFRGYMINYDEMYSTPSLIETRFKNLSKRLGYKACLREDLLGFFAYQFLYTHPNRDKAIFYLKYRTECYPKSVKAWESLSNAYKLFGNEAESNEALLIANKLKKRYE